MRLGVNFEWSKQKSIEVDWYALVSYPNPDFMLIMWADCVSEISGASFLLCFLPLPNFPPKPTRHLCFGRRTTATMNLTYHIPLTVKSHGYRTFGGAASWWQAMMTFATWGRNDSSTLQQAYEVLILCPLSLTSFTFSPSCKHWVDIYRSIMDDVDDLCHDQQQRKKPRSSP